MRSLLLSAGGAFGAYQAGVWQSLEEAGLHPDLLAGASIGAVNAAAIARGASARRLQEWWRDPASNVFHGSWARSLRRRLEELLQEFPHRPDSRPLLVTATRLPSSRLEVFRDSAVDPAVLLASCAVPLFFPPVRIHGRLYVDGGLFRRLPIVSAPEPIVVDLLAAPPSRLLRLAARALIACRSLWISEPEAPAPALAISPAEPLGSLRDLFRWDRARVDRWIQQGYRDACRALATASPAHSATPIADSAAPR
jgi:NTE family protein